MFFAVEDDLSEALLRRTCEQIGFNPLAFTKLGRQSGDGQIIKNISKYANLAQHYTVVIILDLDRRPCPVEYVETLRQNALVNETPKGLILRIAVTEAESWVLADPYSWAGFVGSTIQWVTSRRDWEKVDAKEALIESVKAKASREKKLAIAPRAGGDSKVGLEYNIYLADHVYHDWNALRAAENSESLARFINKLRELL